MTDPAKAYWDMLPKETVTDEIKDLLKEVRSTDPGWSQTAPNEAKAKLKSALFVGQQSVCAYCRTDIAPSLGHAELDHILPKNGSVSQRRHRSNDRQDRKSTAGYPRHTFEPYNLVLTCKRCNNQKGTYDSRKDRGRTAPPDYTLDPDFYEWIHPYSHNYSEHITILKDLIYQATNSSENGLAVIEACGLDQIEAAEALARALSLLKFRKLKRAILALACDSDRLSIETMVGALSRRFPEIPVDVIERHVVELIEWTSKPIADGHRLLG